MTASKKHQWRKWLGILGVGGALVVAAGSVPLGYAAEPPAANSSAVASAEQLKTEAWAALREGNFQRANDSLSKAANLSGDASLKQMAEWSAAYEKQRETFAASRHKEFEKAAKDAKLLIDHKKAAYIIDAISSAYLLADDKKAFLAEPWVKDAVDATIQFAHDLEAKEDWLKAMRLYFDLSTIDPLNPKWKNELKVVTRRARLLAIYAPDVLKQIQDATAKERDEIEAMLRAATQPSAKAPTTPKPATQPDNSDIVRTDWHEMLRGVTMSTLQDAVNLAAENYYRDVTLKQLAAGGLEGMKIFLTTKGLETSFPKLADAAKREKFIKFIDDQIARVQAVRIVDAKGLVDELLGSSDGDFNQRFGSLRTMNSQTVDLPAEVLVNEFAEGAFAELDPFSNMIWPSELDEFRKQTQGEFSGVGISIRTDADGNLRVITPLEDSPAQKAGIKANDVISKINGKIARGITTTQAVKFITGISGTHVTLTVRSPNGNEKDYDLVRGNIKVESVKGWTHESHGWDWYIDPKQQIAYIRLTGFTRTTGEDLEDALDHLTRQGVKGVIFDLRGNPGGLLTAAIQVADRFIKEGVIVSTRADRQTPNQATEADAHPELPKINVPMIVLVNQLSASASEIVSGALKDHHRAKIVGERSYGKGSVQMLFQLQNRQAALKLTTSHYYLPSGRCLHREENSTEWGVDPDVAVEVTPEQMLNYQQVRQDADVLRDANDPNDKAPTETQTLDSDAQLSAALLLMRLQLAGAQI